MSKYASHAGITLGEDVTHQILEDLGLMKMLPGMTVINTCDYEQTRKATHAVANFRTGLSKIWAPKSTKTFQLKFHLK